jgi:hypothetical protein
MLAEFGSVIGAVQMAAEAQQAITQRNSELPEDRRIEFRIGINFGDVVIDGDDIHGDGVNLAARLEEAELHHQMAFSLNPNDPRVVVQRSELLNKHRPQSAPIRLFAVSGIQPR